MKRSEAFLRASAHFLKVELPVYWEDMAEDQLLEYLKKNAIEEFEGTEPEYLYEIIEILAYDFLSISNESDSDRLN